jgi:DNA end-binding protein Ku
VDADEIDPIYLDSPYYMAPDGPIAEETYAVILEAMKRAKKVAVATIVLNGRERLVAINPLAEGFKLTTLRSAKEIREASGAIDKFSVKLAPDMLAMAGQIINSKKIPFAPEKFEDRYEDALMALVKSKIAGGEPVIMKAPERGNVVNLMDALRRSIEEERRPAAPSLSKGAAKGADKAAKPAKAKAAAPKKKSKAA